MGTLNEIKKRSKEAIGPVLGICIVGYFAYHAVQGERGFNAYRSLQQQVTEAQVVETQLSAKRDKWEHRVKLLRPDNLDPDMLEERARAMLNFGRKDEIIILTND
ncbi:MAG: septum formation initiator family protein [Alphaproteobacteria bacterium]|nr:septum formation initiator family protein [Rhodospirillales bacterium]MCW9044729.1 septum formation initiator family protein [Alphaproteobacteria bacterium]